MADGRRGRQGPGLANLFRAFLRRGDPRTERWGCHEERAEWEQTNGHNQQVWYFASPKALADISSTLGDMKE